jgi:hypothetical protein
LKDEGVNKSSVLSIITREAEDNEVCNCSESLNINPSLETNPAPPESSSSARILINFSMIGFFFNKKVLFKIFLTNRFFIYVPISYEPQEKMFFPEQRSIRSNLAVDQILWLRPAREPETSTVS